MAHRLNIQPYVPIILAATLLFIPLKWFSAWLIAVALHEASHIICLILFQKKILEVRIGVRGVSLLTSPLDFHEEFFCAISGPAGSFILCLLHKIWPELSICAFAHLIFNLLPIYPLDGGRVLFCILRRLLDPEKAAKVHWRFCATAGLILFVVVLILGIKFPIGPIPLLLACYVLYNCGKFPCKWPELKVQ